MNEEERKQKTKRYLDLAAKRYKQLSEEWWAWAKDPYPKQREFMRLGATKKERCLMAANQTGKTRCAAMEIAYHMTGLYPDWWQGKRFDQETIWWIGSETGELCRDGAQRKLLGSKQEERWYGGAIPGALITDYKMSRAVPDAVEIIKVKHVNGKLSEGVFKAYSDGREKWQAGTVHGVWPDEEPTEDIYTEAYTRTVATDGIVMMTFTPLKGLSNVVLRFPSAWNPAVKEHPDRALINMTLDDVPPYPIGHFTDEAKRQMIAAYPVHEVEARTKGYPMLGTGRVFPVPEDWLVEDDFVIPDIWPQIIGLDFGWDHPTAAVKLAWDKESNCVHVTTCYRQSRETPLYHAAAVKPWGAFPCAWPHDALQHDKGSGEQLASIYRRHGLKMLTERAQFPDDRGYGLEAGLQEMLERMQTSQLKVFRSCGQWFEEFRSYHRKDGKVVKEREDLMSATRYGIMMLRYAQPLVRPEDKPQRYRSRLQRFMGRTWMSA